MWKYMCRRQLTTLVLAFAAGFLMSLMFNANETFLTLVEESMAPEAVAILESNPHLIDLSAGLGFAGIANVFLLGNLLSAYYPRSMFILLFLFVFLPEMTIMVGTVSAPVVFVLSLIGSISLYVQQKKALKAAGITGDDEIVERYLLLHPLDEQYAPLGLSVKKTIVKIRFAYVLGMIAVAAILFALENMMIAMILLFVCLLAFQQLSRIRSTTFASITTLLVDECDPEACMSALLSYSRHGSHYRIANRSLAAQCLIYLDEPQLAKDVLILFQRPSLNAEVTYYTLMGNADYQLRNEPGLISCTESLKRLRLPSGPMGMMIKSQQVGMLENKIHLMNGDFNECKKYFLMMLKSAQYNLLKAECSYYIALISFVQRDYVLAKMYFEKTLEVSNRLYYTSKAQSYLDKIAQDARSDDETITYVIEHNETED